MSRKALESLACIQEGRAEDERHKRELAEQLQGEADTERSRIQVCLRSANRYARTEFGSMPFPEASSAMLIGCLPSCRVS